MNKTLWQPTSVPKGILLDIEGTTSSIEFVYNIMFPFARERMRSTMEQVASDPGLQSAMRQVSQDAGHGEDFETWLGTPSANQSGKKTSADTDLQEQNNLDQNFVEQATKHLLGLMDNDSKSTGLKSLQGQIWKSGFESGELKSHLYDDVYPALLRWARREIDTRIYSSGSVVAQKLFFGHTPMGDLRQFFKGFYDTTIGSKRESDSYHKISEQFAVESASIVFFSDNAAELAAANDAGLIAVAVVRPGNPALPDSYNGPIVHSFSGLW